MISQTEQDVLENICGGSVAALHDIHSIISKVYDEELSYDLHRQAARYSGFREKAADSLLSCGIVPQPAGILERAKRWTEIQAGTALNVSTGHLADMIMKAETRRLKEIEGLLEDNHVSSHFSCELAEEFVEFEKENLRTLQSYL